MNIRHDNTRYSPITVPSYNGELKRDFKYSFDIEKSEKGIKMIVCLAYIYKTTNDLYSFDFVKSISEYLILGNVTMIDLYNVVNFTFNTLREYLAKANNIPSPFREVPVQSPELKKDELVQLLEQLNS